MEKLNSYYERSAESDAHIMAMGDNALISLKFVVCAADLCAVVLDPTKKMSHFQKHWPSDLVSDVEDAVQTRVSHLLSLYDF
jgi:hypothetical protein